MFKLFVLLISPLLVFGFRKESFHNELRRQYDDYLKIFKKVETPRSFDNFVYNLNTIENFNQENNDCRMYLTQHSDTLEDEYLHKKCKN